MNRSKRLDLGIVTLPLHTRELETQSLTNDDIVLVSRSDHPLAQRRQINASALRDQGFVSFEADTALRNLIDNAVKFMGDQAAPRIEIGCRPGGNPGAGRVRLALVAPVDECVEAARRIRRYVRSL